LPFTGHVSAVLLLHGLIVVTAFAALAILARGVTLRGALAGWLLTLLIFFNMSWPGFLLVLLSFLLTLAATRIGEGRRHTPRGFGQVASNLIVAALASFVSPPASIAALCELAADTSASELGRRFGRDTFLFPTFRRVPAGTEGGVSFVGTITGVAAALILAASAAAMHLTFARPSLLLLAAIFGMFTDSLAGALLETRGLINNNAVNVLGTLTAALSAFFIFR